MKIVISDTGPIHYLQWIGQINLLPSLYETVIIPTRVLKELQDARAPHVIQEWALNPPLWLHVKQAINLISTPKNLDRGELEALSLASELNADLVLIDETDGRHMAAYLDIPYVGTLGIIIAAVRYKVLSSIEAEKALIALGQTNMRIHPQLLKEAIAIVLSLKS